MRRTVAVVSSPEHEHMPHVNTTHLLFELTLTENTAKTENTSIPVYGLLIDTHIVQTVVLQ